MAVENDELKTLLATETVLCAQFGPKRTIGRV